MGALFSSPPPVLDFLASTQTALNFSRRASLVAKTIALGRSILVYPSRCLGQGGWSGIWEVERGAQRALHISVESRLCARRFRFRRGAHFRPGSFFVCFLQRKVRHVCASCTRGLRTRSAVFIAMLRPGFVSLSSHCCTRQLRLWLYQRSPRAAEIRLRVPARERSAIFRYPPGYPREAPLLCRHGLGNGCNLVCILSHFGDADVRSCPIVMFLRSSIMLR